MTLEDYSLKGSLFIFPRFVYFFYIRLIMNNEYFDRELSTNRLKLRKFVASDASAISELLKYREVASTTLRLPFPCSVEEARDMILKYLEEEYEKGRKI